MVGPDGTKYPNYSTFKEVVRPERIVFAHGGRREDGPEIMKEMTWTFDEVEEGRTRLTLRQVYPSTEMLERVVKEFGAIEGARHTLERLEESLALETPEGVTITRKFDAPRELVWRAWTEAEHIANWWGPKGTACSNCKLDLRPPRDIPLRDARAKWLRDVGEICLSRGRGAVPAGLHQLLFGCGGRHYAPPDERHLAAGDPEPAHARRGRKRHGDDTGAAPVNANEEERKTFKAGHAGMQYGLKATFDHLAEHLKEHHAQLHAGK